MIDSSLVYVTAAWKRKILRYTVRQTNEARQQARVFVVALKLALIRRVIRHIDVAPCCALIHIDVSLLLSARKRREKQNDRFVRMLLRTLCVREIHDIMVYPLLLLAFT